MLDLGRGLGELLALKKYFSSSSASRCGKRDRKVDFSTTAAPEEEEEEEEEVPSSGDRSRRERLRKR